MSFDVRIQAFGDPMSHEVYPARPQSLTPAASASTDSFSEYPSFFWRVINDLHEDERAHPGFRSRQSPPVTKVMNRQRVDLDVLKRMEEAGIIRASIGADWIDIELKDLTWRQVTSAKGNAQIRIALTDDGVKLARNPINMVLRSCWRAPRRYLVGDVTRSAGIAGPDVKPILVALEGLGLIEAVNDQGVVQLAMWKRAEIPPSLRLRLTRKGGTYLNRK